MRLSGSKYEVIQRTVQEFIEDWGITEYPIDPLEICSNIGIRVCKFSELSPEDEKRAMMASDDGVHVGSDYLDLSLIVIAYNDELVPGRIRFTICHELGHIVLEHGPTVSEEQESEADWFASYLLAPVPLAIKNNLKTMDEIKGAFNLSSQCASVVHDHCRDRLHCNKAAYPYEKELINCCKLKKKEVRYFVSPKKMSP